MPYEMKSLLDSHANNHLPTCANLYSTIRTHEMDKYGSQTTGILWDSPMWRIRLKVWRTSPVWYHYWHLLSFWVRIRKRSIHQVQRKAPPLIQWPTTALYQLLSCVKDIRGKHFPCIACFKKYLGLLPYPSTPPIHFAKCTSLRYNPFFRGGTAKDDELTSAQLRARHAIPGNSRGKLVLLRLRFCHTFDS